MIGRWHPYVVAAVALGIAAVAAFARPWSGEERVTIFAVTAGALGGIFGIIWLATRSYERNQRAHNLAADRHNLALLEIARRLGWQWQPGSDYSHPHVGTLRGWGTVSGAESDLEIQVSWESDSAMESPTEFTTVVLVKPRHGRTFDIGGRRRLRLASKRGKLDRRGKAPFRLDDLDPVVGRLEVTPELLKATLLPDAGYFRSMSYVLRTQTSADDIVAAVRACAAAARSIARA